ncbi:MAG: 23S rRNA (adenine(1618)-N(6))-methyltransferase RlmF [Bacteroidota bacterium]
MHPRNQHKKGYNFTALTNICPELQSLILVNAHGIKTVNFFNPVAVKLLNQALLKLHYNIDVWDIPENHLCPPIPSRADYVHYAADLLAQSNRGILPKGKSVRCVDVGTGASCIYPLLGHQIYGWQFIASDIYAPSLAASQLILNKNPALKTAIQLRLQSNPKAIFRKFLRPNERIDFSFCNPPFYISAEAAQAAAQRKLRQLNAPKKSVANFGGQQHQKWCTGGDVRFIHAMIQESQEFKDTCL